MTTFETNVVGPLLLTQSLLPLLTAAGDNNERITTRYLILLLTQSLLHCLLLQVIIVWTKIETIS